MDNGDGDNAHGHGRRNKDEPVIKKKRKWYSTSGSLQASAAVYASAC